MRKGLFRILLVALGVVLWKMVTMETGFELLTCLSVVIIVAMMRITR